MRIASRLPGCRPSALAMVAAGCLAVWSAAFRAVPAEAGTIEIPAWAFARGNARIHADPAEYADAGPVVGGGPEEPWGWRVEYEVEFPVAGRYALEIRYASAEARPIEVLFDNANKAKTCTHVTFGPASSGKEPELTWKSSGARWEIVMGEFGSPVNL